MAVKAPKKPKQIPGPVFAWREGARFAVPAQVAGEELARMAARSDGEFKHLVPRTVWEESRPEETPLHPIFEWDDETAADLYRDDQARQVIRTVRVVEQRDGDEEPQQRIAYVHVKTADSGHCYVQTATATANIDLRDQMLREAIALLRGVQRRYRDLSELAPIFDAIDQINIA